VILAKAFRCSSLYIYFFIYEFKELQKLEYLAFI